MDIEMVRKVALLLRRSKRDELDISVKKKGLANGQGEAGHLLVLVGWKSKGENRGGDEEPCGESARYST